MSMQAYIVEQECGDLLRKEVPVPPIQNGEVLVAVKALSVNPIDFKVKDAAGLLEMLCGGSYPITLGWDIAGDVVAVGKDVTQLSVGDKVFGMVNFPGRGNAYAEQVAAPADQLALMPEGASYETCAAATLAALTALQALDKGGVTSGSKVLIHAASGGVGHFAVQMAKQRGAHVAATSSAKNKAFVVDTLGADEHIDYRQQAFEDVVSEMDFVLDPLGGDNLDKCISVTKRGGCVVSLPGPPAEATLERAKEAGVDAGFLLVKSSGDDMRSVSELLASGALKPHVARTFAFADLPAALTELAGGRSVGKVIVTV